MSAQGTTIAKSSTKSESVVVQHAAKTPAPAKQGLAFTAPDRDVRVRSFIDLARSKGINIRRVEGVRGKWTGDTGGNAMAAMWLTTESEKGTAITVKGAKFSIDLGLTEKPTPTTEKPVSAKKRK
jgi:hypothetical protein